ncbi:hypothetical protein H6F73_13010 [Microcoleus sp. FACHB-68]|nr:hypothetical protein [Microcoleus sp. FACHB-68]
MGHGAWGNGHGALGIGDWAWGMEHGAWVFDIVVTASLACFREAVGWGIAEIRGDYGKT